MAHSPTGFRIGISEVACIKVITLQLITAFMEDNPDQAASQSMTKAIEHLLERGAIAALVTVVDANEGIGAKLLLEETGDSTGSLGDPLLDAAVAKHAAVFLATREETRAIRVNEFAPNVSSAEETSG